MELEQAQQRLLQQRQNEEAQGYSTPKLKTLGDMLHRFEERPKESEDKAPHERAYWIEKTRKALGNHWKTGKPYSFGQINGLTKGWSVYKIRDRFFYCEKADKEFGFVWFGMRKQDKEKQLA